MEELLDRISQEGLLVVCIVLAVVALLLAILICYELVVARRKNKVTIDYKNEDDNKSSSTNELNIKYDENITYVEENSDEERIRAKEELEKIKNKLIAEDEEKKIEEKKQEQKKVEVAKQIETPIEIEKLEDKDDLEGTKEYKVFTDLPEETKENIKLQIQQQIDEKVAEEKKTTEEVKQVEEPIPVPVVVEEPAPVEEVKEENNEVTNIEVNEIEETTKVEVNDNDEDDDNYTARRNDEVEILPIVEDIAPVEPVVIEEKIEAPTYTARKDDDIAAVEPTPVKQEEKEEVKEEKENVKLDAATKDYLIDEYLKQAILTRINEEKEKQLKLKEQIERERRVLLFDDNNLEIIDSSEPNELDKKTKEVDAKVDNLEKLEDVILEKENVLEDNKPEVEVKPETNKPSVYEELEEENAIISYDELVKASKFGYTDEEMNNYVDEKDAIISMDELQKLFKEVNEVSKDVPTMNFSNVEFKKVEDLPKISEEKKFKKSDVISPVFGQVVDEKELELEKTQNLNKLTEEIKKTNEFLKTLKELQKNLE